MEKTEFLEKHLFSGLKTLDNGSDKDTAYQFSESDFETLIQRAQHFGLGIFTIETSLDSNPYASTTHEDFRKKATDHTWYKKAFQTYKAGQLGLTYAATYKISPKLLARDSFQKEEEE